MTVTAQQFPITPAQLFAVLTNPESYPHWLVGAKDIRDVSAGWPAPGSSFRHVVGFGPLAITDRTSVIDIADPSTLVLRVRARPAIEANVTFAIQAETGGCTLHMTEEPVGVYRLIAPVASPLIKARNARSMQRLLDYASKAYASSAA